MRGWKWDYQREDEQHDHHRDDRQVGYGDLNDTPVDVSACTLRNDIQTTHHGYLISSADGVAYADQIKLGRRERNTKGREDPF
jgi:hypothetical protein